MGSRYKPLLKIARYVSFMTVPFKFVLQTTPRPFPDLSITACLPFSADLQFTFSLFRAKWTTNFEEMRPFGVICFSIPSCPSYLIMTEKFSKQTVFKTGFWHNIVRILASKFNLNLCSAKNNTYYKVNVRAPNKRTYSHKSNCQYYYWA